MPTIDEKRVYSDRETPATIYVAAEQGLVVARLSGDIVGEFSLARRCVARDVAATPEALVVATDDATLVAPDGEPASLTETGFGPAVAVGIHDDHAVAADAEGRVARRTFDEDDWTDLGTVDDPRTIDGPLIAAADGVHRVDGDRLVDAGLTAANDVASEGAPLAATDEGLYELGNGWMVAREGRHVVVDTDGTSAHAVADAGTVFGRVAGQWDEVSLPTEDRVVGFAYDRGVVIAATETGSLLVDAGDGWRSRALGVTGVGALDSP